MSRIALLAALLIAAVAVYTRSYSQTKHARSEGPEASYLRVIDAHCKDLVKLGRVPKGFANCYSIIGQYHWHAKGGGYFGTYEFYQPAFEQARLSWYFHGKVIENSNSLWVEDFDYDAQSQGILFDDSVIGRTVGPMSMTYMSDDKVISEIFTAKVVAVTENGRSLKLDRRAPHHAEQWGMAILPNDYVDMCKCHRGGPVFVDGKPVLE
jgi:hypothetical protein